MPRSNRRSFLKHAGAVAAAATVTSSGRIATAGQANERVVVGIIGCGGRGVQLAKICGSQPDASVAYVCDPDRNRAGQAKAATNADHAVADMRRIFDDRSVDAVVIASCDHWHAPAAVLACKAGKHVYVEKPCSHRTDDARKCTRSSPSPADLGHRLRFSFRRISADKKCLIRGDSYNSWSNSSR